MGCGIVVIMTWKIISFIRIVVALSWHYSDVIMSTMASQIPSITIVYSTVTSGADQGKQFRVTGLCEGNSPVTGEFPAQRASNAENISIWWRHHDKILKQNLAAAKRFHYRLHGRHVIEDYRELWGHNRSRETRLYAKHFKTIISKVMISGYFF